MATSEMRLCSWCGAVCTDRDEHGDPACPHCTSEAAAEAHREEKRLAEAIARDNVIEVPVNVWRDRNVRRFVRGQFRAFHALV